MNRLAIVFAFSLGILSYAVADHPKEEMEIAAKDVMDKKTLKAFVQQAAEYAREDFSKAIQEFRKADGRWQIPGVGIFIEDTNGINVLNPFDPTVEGSNVWNATDVTGAKFIQDFIEVAARGGGFVPWMTGTSDLGGNLKINYAENLLVTSDGRQLVIDAGFYPPSHCEQITARGVVDSFTLKAFVQRAKRHLEQDFRRAMLDFRSDPQWSYEGIRVTATKGFSDGGYVRSNFQLFYTEKTTEKTRTPTGVPAEVVGVMPIPSHCQSPDIILANDITDRPSLQDFVQRAAMHLEADYDQALKDFRTSPEWINGSTYLYIFDQLGNNIFHATQPQLEGKSLWNFVDTNGVYYVQELIQAAQDGGGFVEYLWENPAVAGDEVEGSLKVGHAQLISAVDDHGMPLVLGSGIYPSTQCIRSRVVADDVIDRRSLRSFVRRILKHIIRDYEQAVQDFASVGAWQTTGNPASTTPYVMDNSTGQILFPEPENYIMPRASADFLKLAMIGGFFKYQNFFAPRPSLFSQLDMHFTTSFLNDEASGETFIIGSRLPAISSHCAPPSLPYLAPVQKKDL